MSQVRPGTCHVTRDQRMNLAYVGHVLGQLHGQKPSAGVIVTRDGKAQRVKLEDSYASLGKTLTALTRVVGAAPARSPGSHFERSLSGLPVP